MRDLFRGRPGEPPETWAVLKDIIRSELEPLRVGMDSLAREVATLRTEVRETQDSSYSREMVDQLLTKRDERLEVLEKRQADACQEFADFKEAQEKRAEASWTRIGIVAGVAGTLAGIFGMVLEHLVKVFGG